MLHSIFSFKQNMDQGKNHLFDELDQEQSEFTEADLKIEEKKSNENVSNIDFDKNTPQKI